MASSRRQEARRARHSGIAALKFLVALAIVQQGAVPPCRATFVTFGTNSSDTSQPFRVGFYSQSCPNAETIVTSTLTSAFASNFKAPAQIIRLFFHECWITGCDASLLTDSTSTNQAEKAATPNLSVAGFAVIDTAKAALEQACPGVVSCADIEALIARDAINILGGPFFAVPTGRLDTRATTTAATAAAGLPQASYGAQTAALAFAAQGFSVTEFVTLLGAHTVGAAHCQQFSYRLYNFQGTGQATTIMDPKLVATLKTICPLLNVSVTLATDPSVGLDQGTINTVDNSYFQQIQRGHGILEVDQNIGLDPVTGPVLTAYASGALNFDSSFATVVTKLGTLNVITGSPGGSGSIRQNCAILN